jgi:hypothetical protein
MRDVVTDKPASTTTLETALNYLEFTGGKPVSHQYVPPCGQ